MTTLEITSCKTCPFLQYDYGYLCRLKKHLGDTKPYGTPEFVWDGLAGENYVMSNCPLKDEVKVKLSEKSLSNV